MVSLITKTKLGLKGELYICLLSESNGPNLLDETFERLHSEPYRLSLEVS